MSVPINNEATPPLLHSHILAARERIRDHVYLSPCSRSE